MATKYYKMSAAELSVFFSNFITIAEANKDALHLTNDTITVLQTEKVLLDTKLIDRQAKKEAAVASTTSLKLTVKNVKEVISSVNKIIKSYKDIPAELIELVGLDAEDKNLTPIVPVAPTNLVVEGRSNGINYLRWENGGNKPRTTYIIEAKIADSAEFVFIKSTTKTRFQHKNQIPGVKVFYRIKAVHGEIESAYSNPAVIYNN